MLDNQSTHTPASLYNALPAEEARRILRRIEFHYTPQHASWLNMVEIGVLQRQCLSRRIPDRATLAAETAAWEKQRNASKAQVNWTFTADKSRDSMARVYPKPDASKASDKPSRSL